MPRNSRTTATIAVTTNVALEWDDQASIQSLNSSASYRSSDFWYNWSPKIDLMIIKHRANYLVELEATIAKDNLTFELLGKCYLDQRPPCRHRDEAIRKHRVERWLS